MVRDLEHQILVDDADLLVDVDPGGRQRPRSGLTVRGYELREELGRGAFGAVFRAYQPIVGREVAIKVITSELADDPEFIRRFEAEAQLVAGLEHPHIVPLYDYWREPGAAYLVMRLVRDRHPRRRPRRRGAARRSGGHACSPRSPPRCTGPTGAGSSTAM